MKDYICKNCYSVFSEENLPLDKYENIEYECPYCECKEIVEAHECGVCGDFYAIDDLEWEICEDCYEYYYTFENAINFGDKNKKQIEINGYLASEFDELQIEDILKREIEQIKHSVKLKHKDYLLDNDFDYKKEEKENENRI